MSLLQRLLLLPLLSPLLAVLLLGALNPRPWVALRLLTWSSPAWPLGAWISGAAAAGAALSAAATGLALQSGAPLVPTGARRQVRWRRRDEREASDGFPETTPPEDAAASPDSRTGWGGWAGPSRAAADPPPTVAVPYRVIRKGSGHPAAQPPKASATATAPAGTHADASASADGWDSPMNDDW
ncbi:MAG: hypothetical protein ACO3FA_08105 [Vulcanococcus sp.]